MSAIEVLRSPWSDRLAELASAAGGSVRICSPFVSRAGTRCLLDAVPEDSELALLSSFNAAYFSRGYSDTNAFRDVLARGGRVRNCQKLHAKIYLFDADVGVVTSANLTNGGLRGNLECGVLLRDAEALSRINDYFESLWEDEVTGPIGVEILDGIDAIVKRLPSPAPAEREAIAELEQTLSELVLENAEASILGSLSGWRRAVFEVLTRIDGRYFELSDVYDHTPDLAQQYPGNENVQAKVRQQLQQLRDLGLVRFCGGGSYVKLWG
jgi:hypothetical protein